MIDIIITDDDIDSLITEYNARVNNSSKHWVFDKTRRHVLKSWDDVQACPGSGKTTIVAAKLLILANKWQESHRGVCVITHTNVARDEIVSRLYDHPAGHKLLSYPHFIGTVQEFVNRYLGLPFCRSNNLSVTGIDDDACVQVIEKNIGYGTKAFLSKRYASLRDLKIKYENGELKIKVPGFPKESKARSYGELLAAKTTLIERGLFFFSEMYCFANNLIDENPDIIGALRQRFPMVLIDEMQDTQKPQDTLLNKIFDDAEVLLQRFGDPDQAIFDGIGGDGPNESYNCKAGLYEIKSSHRFGLDICEKILGLSYNGLDQLSSSRTPSRSNAPHTVFLYDDASQKKVLEAFGHLVASADKEKNWETVKAVGGVDGESGQIRNYWPKFDKTKSTSSPKPKKLIHILYLCHGSLEGHVSSKYELFVQGVVDLLRKADVKIEAPDENPVSFSKQSLIRWLKQNEKYNEFRKFIASWMMEDGLSAETWVEQVVVLKSIFELGLLNAEAEEYLSFCTEYPEKEGGRTTLANKYVCSNGCEIVVGTIHSVKGETHDATLMLETKFNRWFDVSEMLPFILEIGKKRPVFVPNSKTKESTLASYMRRLYVAGSRPRHLLCMALHKEHITQDQIRLLGENGWLVSSVE